VCVAEQQLLCVGVDGNEFDAAKTGFDHSVDGVYATTADADDLDNCEWITAESHLCALRFEEVFELEKPST
jgi:hypothetical protein